MSSVNPGSVRAIAKKDFQDAVRSWLFWGLSVFFFFIIVGLGALVGYLEDEFSTEALISILSQSTRLIIPVIAIVLGWKAIAGERESGSIKVLLSLPHSRRDVILGKLLGRSAVLTVSLVIGFLLAGAVVGIMIGSFAIGDFLGLLAISIIYGIAYTSIAVSISSLTRSTTVAAAAGFFVFALFYIIWNIMIIGLDMLRMQGYISGVEYTFTANGNRFQTERLPDWALFINNIDPGNAFANALTLTTEASGLEGAGMVQDRAFADGIPFFLQDWFSFVVLLLWIVLPVVVALLWFDRTDL
ncbi:ABC transporter permease [Halostagnicola sp. A-GB9-2]|uniref:ABC transporter permease n=1 Tax=Halostagnicola sp. A-GB9-2 TaxID=3048066 RepID=UPI0024C0455A|nr:ABC transporter permease [Halostagnicola sp. A-GB9-2]MDJ1432633.1 ABC transporter permease [Halostagnicola sp. A-GB9-2]